MSGLTALRKIRADNGWTQESLAKRLGVSFATVSRWERGEKFPREKQRQKLAKLTGIPFHELLASSAATGSKQ
jgi:transcriptional regulator with XRE-family HTH domain